MKAIVFHQHGGPEVLQVADLPLPRPEAGEFVSARLARPAAQADADGRHREGRRKDIDCLAGGADFPHRDRPGELRRQGRDTLWVVDQVERRDPLPPVKPRLQRDFSADPGGLAHRQGDWQNHRGQTLTSTKALRRKTRK